MEFDKEKIKELKNNTTLHLAQTFQCKNNVQVSMYGDVGNVCSLKKLNLIKYMILIGDKVVDLKHVEEVMAETKAEMMHYTKEYTVDLLEHYYLMDFTKHEMNYIKREDFVDMYLILKHYADPMRIDNYF